MTVLISAVLFLTVVLFVEGSYLAYAALHNPEYKRVRHHLHDSPARSNGSLPIDITRKSILSDVPWLQRVLYAIPLMQSLGRLVEQANSPHRLSVFLGCSLVLFFAGLLILQKPFNIGGGVGLGLLPFAYLSRQRQRRLQRFERQLPEALDFVARALKAGHTFNVGMKMVGDEFLPPIGTEFAKTVDEINFGGGIQEALENLSYRIDCADLRFFVTSLMVQRETGGNLAEIIEKTSQLIRQRFELLGRVRVLAGEGKLSAIILIALPFFIGLTTYYFRREYLTLLFTDPTGKWLVVVAGFSMALGILVIIRMIRITV
ncbi:MAG TPA: type II secretion system F family protein [Candidatus Tectomicrobia bacterium]|jgi:tight adherence protein B